MKIENIKTSDLIPYARNAKKHDAAQVAKIAGSIREFGFNNPVLIDKDNGIIAGHGRVMAAQSLSLDTVPCIRLGHLSDTQRRAYILADNRLAEIGGGWDEEMLKLELAELGDLDVDLDAIGFGAEDLAEMEMEEVTGNTDPDEVPEPPVDPVTVLGDVWVLGNHRLMCGDSTSIDAVNLLMEGRKAQMVHTDPPYGIEYQSNYRTKSAKFEQLKNDDVFLDVAPIIDACSDGWVFVWTSWKVLTKWLDQFASFGYPSNQVIWHKPGGGIGDLKKTFCSDYETALVWHRGAELTGKRIGSVWKITKDGANEYLHPTQKPVALAQEAIDKTTRPGWLILDLFGGSGSTLIACEKTNRHARLMELDPKYCDVIVKRWQDFTGKKAIHESSGKTFDETKASKP
jgi:DNA modification methylase